MSTQAKLQFMLKKKKSKGEYNTCDFLIGVCLVIVRVSFHQQASLHPANCNCSLET